MFDRRHIFEIEASKPKSLRQTMARFWQQFEGRHLYLLIMLVLAAFSTWAYVKSPEIIGNAIDDYLTPGNGLSRSESISGLRDTILLLLGLYFASALTTGLQFYVMRWAGLHVLRDLRVKVFHHIHRLSLSHYTRNEAGDIMSRITNDTDTLQQAITFALVQVIRGGMIIAWLIYNMLTRSVAFALVAMVTVPFMVLATIWFSNQARKAFRRARREIGGVNADLQENIAGVREAQAFTREDENIARFRESNAANRDANIRAVAFTSALAPVLEALGYIAIVIVAGVGGILMLRGEDLFGTTLTLGLIITFVLYSQQFNQPIQMIATLWTNVQSAIAGAERIFEFLDTVPEVTDKPNALDIPPD